MFKLSPLLGLVTIIALLSNCSVSPTVSNTKFDAAHSIPLYGIIQNGKILTYATSESEIKDDINSQLYYTTGQLNHYYSVADLSQNEITVIGSTPSLLEEGLYEVNYSAKLYVSWDTHTPVPSRLEMIMPARMDSGIYTFIEGYAEECREDTSHDVELGNFWYYYRPLAYGCDLATQSVLESAAVVSRFDMTFEDSNTQTQNKYPEYTKIWEDGRLVVTAIFGKNEATDTTEFDAGAQAYNRLYTLLRQNFGTPTSISVNLGGDTTPAPEVDRIVMTFNTVAGDVGELEVGMMIVDGIRDMTTEQTDFYNERTKTSDFVNYSGHSGLGANIRALTNLGTFLPNQYQIFFVNGCDTFAYVENSLRNAHQNANPGSGPNKYFDIITNSMPSYFHENANGNIAIIRALIGQNKTYRQILAEIDPQQRAVVTGEEDNAFPGPF